MLTKQEYSCKIIDKNKPDKEKQNVFDNRYKRPCYKKRL